MGALMENDLPQRQNEPRMLELQAAARALYRRAAAAFNLQAVLAAAVPVAFSLLLFLVPRVWPGEHALVNGLKIASAFFGLAVILLDDLVLDGMVQQAKQQAALAQEMFDRELFGLPWATRPLGRRLAIADVDRLARRWKAADPAFDAVRDWYPAAAGRVPLHVARVICQRMNLWWDAGLRRGYTGILAGFAAVLALGVVALSVSFGLAAGDMLMAAMTLAPAFRWALRERRRHATAAAALERQDGEARSLMDAVLEGLPEAEATARSAELQDDIHERRRTSPLGFRWLYASTRGDRETAMNADAAACVDQYLGTHGLLVASTSPPGGAGNPVRETARPAP